MEVESPGSSRRFHGLDLWRGLVCLYVVLEHAGVALWDQATGDGAAGRLAEGLVGLLKLNVGTALFFAMSGYCMAASVDSARRRGEPAASVMARRFWRIFPPYWAALLGFVLVVGALDLAGLDHYHRSGVALELLSPGRLDAWQWLGNLTLTETWRPMIGGPTPEVFTRVAWSLCYQEQFYLICFAALIVARARFHRALFAISAVILAARVVAWDAGMLHRISGTFPIFWQEFAVGLAVYARLSLPTTPAARRAIELGLIGLLGVGLRTGFDSTAAAAAFGLALIVLHRWDGRLDGRRVLAPLRSCGRLSYSLYLVHLPVVMLVNGWLCRRGLDGFWPRALVLLPLAALASVAAAWAFHRLVERHFLRLPSRWAGSITSPAPADAPALPEMGPRTARAPWFIPIRPRTAAGAGVALLSLGLAASAAWSAVAPRSSADRPAWRAGSEREGPDGWARRHEAMVARSVAQAPRVLLLGDSILDAWDDGPASWLDLFAPLGAANLGISGDHTQHLLWRIEHGALRAAPEVVVLMVGTNNLSAGMTADETARGVSAVVEAVHRHAPRSRILLLGLLPRHHSPTDPIRDEIRRVNARLALLADGRRVRFVDAGHRFLNAQGRLATELVPDALHPSEPGYRVLADAIAGPLRELLGDPGSGA